MDAIRWCLGEQSMRDLRSQRAEDVIYAGPRSSLGMAEVIMVFEAMEAEEDLPWTELNIARRLFRSGESEYVLNRSRVRLRDVHAALHTIGIDSGRHIVVNQGMADALLSAGPLERRGLLEQAAGLSGYREQRDEARHKLATTRQNIATVEVVLAEMEPRLRLLRRQAKAVEDADDLRQRLRSTLNDWYCFRWRALCTRLVATEEEAGTADECRRRLGSELERLENMTESRLTQEREWNERHRAARDALHDAERQLAAARQESARIETALTAATDEARALALRLPQLEEATTVARARRWTEEESAGEIRERLEQLAKAALDLEQRLDPMTAEAERAESQARAARRAALEEGLALERARRRIDQVTDRAREVQAQIDDRTEWLRRSQQRLAGASRNKEAAETALHRAVALAEERSAAAAECRRAVSAHTVKLERLDGIRRRIVSDLKATEDAKRSAQRLLNGLAPSLDGSLIARLPVPEGWERAIAVALGSWARSGVDSSLTLFTTPVTATYFEWRDTLADDLPGGALWADMLVESSDGPAALAGTLLVDGEEDALRAWERLAPRPAYLIGTPPLRVVTREGLAIDALGKMQARDDDQAALYVQATHALDAASRRAAHLSRRLESLNAGRDRIASALEGVRSSVGSAAAAAEAAAIDVRRCEESLEQIRRDQRRLTNEQTEVSVQTDRLSAERQGAVDELESLKEEATRRQRALDLLDDEVQKVEANASRTRQAAAVMRAQLSSAQMERDSLHSRQQMQTELIDMLCADAERLAGEHSQAEARRSFVEEEARRLHVTLAETRGEIERLAQEVRLQSEAVEAVRSGRPDDAPRADELRQARATLAAAIARHEHAVAALDVLKAERDELERAALAELSAPVESLLPHGLIMPTDEDVRRLRAKVAQSAEIDPAVLAEFRELQTRRDRLRAQIGDLQAAANDLEEIMAVADREMRRRFGASLRAVGDEFSRVFRLMLRGGDAELEQVDGEGGIDIRARLPGRRARASASFSGGERALVASALLFGVLKIRPTPFCVLDEVDAALDESNVDRYLDVLKDISKATQIIVVTHNRATMAAADILYGTTMNDEGVSSLLSMRLDAYGAAG